MRFVDNAREAWKWASVRLHVLATALVAIFLAEPEMPAALRELVPADLAPALVALWLIVGVLARVVQFAPRRDQEGTPDA